MSLKESVSVTMYWMQLQSVSMCAGQVVGHFEHACLSSPFEFFSSLSISLVSAVLPLLTIFQLASNA
jgi:hypothetical protein